MRTTRQKQQGISFLGLLIVGAILAYLVVIGAKVVPSVSEYMAINKAAKQAASEGTTVPAIRAAFDRQATVGYITSVGGKDLEIGKVNDRVVVRYAYDKEIPLGGPAFLVIKYRGESMGGP